MRRLGEIRTAALIAGVTASLILTLGVRDTTRQMIAIDRRGGTSWTIPFIALALPVAGILPVFLFTLYRNRGTIRIPRRPRMLALCAATVLGILLFSELTGLIGSIPTAAGLLRELSNSAYILLLIALFRDRTIEAPGTPASRPLRLAAKVASIIYGGWAAHLFVALALSPIAYWQLRDYALQHGIRPPATWTMELNHLRTALSQACLFAAPYVVYSATRRNPEAPSDRRAIIEVAPAEHETGGEVHPN
jgi:hypothetical protein